MLVKYIKQRIAKMRRKPRKQTVENQQPRIEPVIDLNKSPDFVSQPLSELELFATEAEPVWTLESELSLLDSEDTEEEPVAQENKHEKPKLTQETDSENHPEESPVVSGSAELPKVTTSKLKIEGAKRRKISTDKLKAKQTLRKKQLLNRNEQAKQEQARQEREQLQLELSSSEEGVKSPSSVQLSLSRSPHQRRLEFGKLLTPEDLAGYSDSRVISVPEDDHEVSNDDEVAWSDAYLDQVVKQQVNDAQFFGIPDEIYSWEESTLVDDENDLDPIQGGALSTEDRAWQLASKIAEADTNWNSDDSEVLVSVLVKHNNHWQTRRALSRLVNEYDATPEEIGALLEIRGVWKNSQYTRVLRSNGSAVEGWPNLPWRLGLDVLRLVGTEDSAEGMLFIEDCFDDWSCSPALMKGFPCFAIYLSHIISHFRRFNQRGIKRLLPYPDVTALWLSEIYGGMEVVDIPLRNHLEDYGLLPELSDHSPWPHVSDQLTAEDYAEAIAK